MRLKRGVRCSAVIAALLAVVALSGARAADANMPVPIVDDADRLAVARSVISVMFPPESRQSMIEHMMAAIGTQMRAAMKIDTIADPGFRQIMIDYLDNIPRMLRPATAAFLPKQMDAMAQAYARIYTLAQLKDLAGFAATPSGRSYLQHVSDAISDPAVAEANKIFFQQAFAITQQAQAELKDKIAAYLKDHPNAVPKNPK